VPADGSLTPVVLHLARREVGWSVTERETHLAVFIVRLARDPTGRVTGVVERVRTGEKERFAEVEEIGSILAEMLGREESEE
jgi:hypothetical protein